MATAVSALAACDTQVGNIASLGPVIPSAGRIVITPSTGQIHVGGVIQLTTNATIDQVSQLEWNSAPSTVATVSPTGLVTGFGTGTAVITVQVASDTTITGTAIITVIP